MKTLTDLLWNWYFLKGRIKKKKKEHKSRAFHWHWYITACVGHKLPESFCTEKDNMYCVVMLCKIKKDKMKTGKSVFYVHICWGNTRSLHIWYPCFWSWSFNVYSISLYCDCCFLPWKDIFSITSHPALKHLGFSLYCTIWFGKNIVPMQVRTEQWYF